MACRGTALPVLLNLFVDRLFGYLTPVFQLTNSIEKNPSWEADSRLIDLQILYRIYKSPTLSLFWCTWIQPTLSRPIYLRPILNIMLPSTPRSSKLCLLFRFSHQICVYASHFYHACLLHICLFTDVFIDVGRLWKGRGLLQEARENWGNPWQSHRDRKIYTHGR
jgi:hypothetical protein